MILTKLLKIEQLMYFKEYHDSVEFMKEEMAEINRAKNMSKFSCYEEFICEDEGGIYEGSVDMINRVQRSELFNRLETHLKTVGLMANCCQDYNLGIQSIRKILSKDQLFSFLTCP